MIAGSLHADSESLGEYLAIGVVAEDLPALHALLAARKLLTTFTALFHGGEEAVIVRLLVLRDIGARSSAPN